MVVSKATHTELLKQLKIRTSRLHEVLEARELLSDREGCSRGRWRDPSFKVKLKSSASDIRLAVEDFKNVLAELKKLK